MRFAGYDSCDVNSENRPVPDYTEGVGRFSQWDESRRAAAALF